MLKWLGWCGLGLDVQVLQMPHNQFMTCRPSVTGIKWRCTKDEEQGLESEGCMGISIGRFAIGHMP